VQELAGEKPLLTFAAITGAKTYAEEKKQKVIKCLEVVLLPSKETRCRIAATSKHSVYTRSPDHSMTVPSHQLKRHENSGMATLKGYLTQPSRRTQVVWVSIRVPLSFLSDLVLANPDQWLIRR